MYSSKSYNKLTLREYVFIGVLRGILYHIGKSRHKSKTIKISGFQNKIKERNLMNHGKIHQISYSPTKAPPFVHEYIAWREFPHYYVSASEGVIYFTSSLAFLVRFPREFCGSLIHVPRYPLSTL